MTTPTTRDEFFDALRENRQRPKGRPMAAIAEELVEAAEAFGDPEVTVSTLTELMRAYHGSGESVKFPVAFARLLQLWDEDPKYFDENEAHQLFWYFKWVTSGLLTTPDVPLASIRGWIDEMRRRYRAAEHDLQPVHAQEFHLARQLGENELLAYELWATRGRTELSDCAACEARQRAGFHFRHGADERGLEELKPTFEGTTGCDEEPHTSQALAMLPLLRLGRYDEARAAHLAGYRKVRGQESELSAIGEHLEFCALTGNEARGLELLAQNRASFGFMAAPGSRLGFLTGVEVLLARLVETGHGELPCAGPRGTDWTVAALRDSLAAEADALAARFDARNGNTAVSDRRRERLATRPLVAQLNLGVQTAALAQPVAEASPAVVAAAVVPAAELPEDLDALLAEVRSLDRTGNPRARLLWDALIARSEQDGAELDELARGEIASELAQRAVQRKEWDACAERLAEAVRHYANAGEESRRIAAESRQAWCAAVRESGDGAAAAVESAWQTLETLLPAMDALLAAGFGEADDAAERERETRRRRLTVRQSRVFTARHGMLQANANANGEEQRARWTEVFAAEANTLIAEGTAAELWTQASVALEVLAEYQAMHEESAQAEANARRAIEIFQRQGWPWRLPRGRLLLSLALGGQNRSEEAMAELELGLSEAPADLDPDELTPLHRMLGNFAMRTRQFPTAVRALSEAAARLDREGEAHQARETRLYLGRALCAQGSLGDGVAVLESLLELSGPAAPPAPAASAEPAGEAVAEGEAPSIEAQLTAQIRVDLANALLALNEPRDAAMQFLQLADMVSRWPDKSGLTSAASSATAALAQAGAWDEARVALARALDANRAAPCVSDLTETLRTLATELIEAQGPDALDEALGYLDQADELRAEFADAAREQFRSVEVDRAQCLHSRGQVNAISGRFEEALAAFEEAVAVFDREGFGGVRQRFESVRLAALVEGRSLERLDAARARLDRAAAEADAAKLPDAAATLRRLRESLR